MVHITHKTPTKRSYDTYTGVALGYMAEYDFYMDQEGKCVQIDLLIPEIFIIGAIDDLFIAIFRTHYNKNYQGVYDQGADRGNEIHDKVFGAINKKAQDLLDDLAQAKQDLKIYTDALRGEHKALIDNLRARVSQLESQKANFMEELLQKLR